VQGKFTTVKFTRESPENSCVWQYAQGGQIIFCSSVFVEAGLANWERQKKNTNARVAGRRKRTKNRSH